MNKCIDCPKEIDSRSKRCQKCFHLSRRGVKRPEQSKKMMGKRNPMFGTHRIGLNKGNKHPHLTLYNKTHSQKGKKNNMYGKHQTEKTKKLISKSKIRHHIYGRKYYDILILLRKYHYKLHMQAYFYILDKFGKEGIDAYLKWFKKKFHPKLFWRI